MEELDVPVLKTHDVVTLYGHIEHKLDQTLELTLLQTLDALYIGSRYPGELGLLPDGKPSLPEARQFIDFARKVHDLITRAVTSTTP